MAIGDLPAEYNRKVHGPYDPSRYYGKPDTPFSELRISEIPAWFGRRQKGPKATVGLISRAFWRWNMRYMFPKRTTPAGYYQMILGLSTVFLYLNYSKVSEHRHFKYH